jgi:hypothetical protein
LAHKFWLWPNLLSLDAPLVAVLWQALFVRCLQAPVDLLPAVLLIAAVWLIYTADRALDVWRGAGKRPRHLFYRRHWRVVAPVWLSVLGATAILSWRELPPELFHRGMWLLAAVVVYFGVVHVTPWRFRAKEAGVAVIFALGATVSAWNRVQTLYDLLTVVLFSCLCWINCIAIERWEGGVEDCPGDCPVVLWASCVAIASLLLLHHSRPILGSAEAASAIAFILLDRSRLRLSEDALRVLADAALLSPVLFLPLVGVLS